MKYVIAVVVSALLLVAGCADMTASLWDGRDNAIGARVGLEMGEADELKTEIGGSLLYWPDGENSEEFGAYGKVKFDEIEITNPIPLDFLPEVIKGTPYLGGRVNSDFDDETLIAGIEIENTLFMEYQGDYIFFGLFHKF